VILVPRIARYHNGCHGGKRTSIYLSDDLAAAVEASGVPLAELIRRGLKVPRRRP
jgi:hypothetical protein